MALPTENYVRLPDDSGNTGKKVRTLQRIVGANTVEEHYFVQVSARNKKGVYLINSAILTIVATAHDGIATGWFWFINPIGATIDLAIRRMEFVMQFSTSLSTPTCPRIAVRRFTYSGTPSGAVISPCKRNSDDATPQASFRTAVTGMTVSLDNFAWCGFPVVTAGTAGWTFVPPSILEFEPEEEGMIVLQPGEGILCYQPDAATTSDTRKVTVNMAWEEFDNA